MVKVMSDCGSCSHGYTDFNHTKRNKRRRSKNKETLPSELKLKLGTAKTACLADCWALAQQRRSLLFLNETSVGVCFSFDNGILKNLKLETTACSVDSSCAPGPTAMAELSRLGAGNTEGLTAALKTLSSSSFRRIVCVLLSDFSMSLRRRMGVISSEVVWVDCKTFRTMGIKDEGYTHYVFFLFCFSGQTQLCRNVKKCLGIPSGRRKGTFVSQSSDSQSSHH